MALVLVLLATFIIVARRASIHLALRHRLAEARESFRQYDPKNAIAVLDAVTTEHPQCGEAELLLAAAYRRAGRLDRVEDHLRRAAELGEDADCIDRQFCLTCVQAGDFRRSGSEILDRMLQTASDDEAEEVYEAMARGYLGAMLLEQANFILDGWLAWRPNCVAAHLLRADVAALHSNTRAEIACYRDAVRSDPSSSDARRRLAAALLAAGYVDESHDLFRVCLQQRPRDPDVLVGLAACQHRLAQSEEAKKLLAVALEVQPDNRQRSAALHLLGKIAMSAKDFSEAARFLQQAVDARPANLEAGYALSQALLHAGRADDAKRALGRWERLKALDRKLNDLHEAIATRPEDPDLRTEIGDALLQQGMTEPGVNWLISVLFYWPEHPRANRILAEHYERLGETEMAAKHLAMSRSGAASEVSPPLVLAPTAGGSRSGARGP